MTEIAADRDAVLAALERVTTWPEMARSPQLTRFLDYIVHKRLDGDTQSVKAYSIAVDVFGRPSDFDPQVDPIVRVQARRLRALLEQYYRGPGAEETLQIHLPIGRYVPDFLAEAKSEAASMERGVSAGRDPERASTGLAAASAMLGGRVTVSWFLLLAVAIVIAILAYSFSTWGPPQTQAEAPRGAMQQPRLRIMEFQNLSDDPSISAAVSGLAVELVNRMTLLNYLSVDYDMRGASSPAVMPPDGYTLSGIVRRDPAAPSNFQYSIVLTDMSTNAVAWTRSLTLSEDQLADPGRIDRLSTEVLDVLGSLRGPLHARARAFLAENTVAGEENLYLCRLLFSTYRETSTGGAAERARSCYAALPEQDRMTGVALAAVASLTAETLAGAEDGSVGALLERYRRASEMLGDAIKATPTSSFVWEQRARLHEALAEHLQAEAAYGTSIQSYPSNLDAIAAHARHMALIGQLDQAIPMAERAISALDIVPDWYHAVPVLAALQAEDFATAAQHAQAYSRSDGELGPILELLAAEGSADQAEIFRLLPRILDVPSFRSVGIVTQLRRRITDLALLDRIRTALTVAGVPQLSLVTGY